MKLPWPRDGHCAGRERIAVVVHEECDVAGFEEDDLNAFVSVRFESPILFTGSIPETEAAEAGQYARRKQPARIMPVRQRMELDLAGRDRPLLRRAGINDIVAALGCLSLHGGMFNIQRRR